MTNNTVFDVIIVGGSYAGLSAAMALGRSLRNTLIIDSGKPCNRQTPHSHNFLTQDGKTPKEISSISKQQVEAYPSVSFFNGTAISGKRTNDGFEIQTQNGKVFSGKKLIFATGIKDIMPNIKGFAECWGISVVHCPYCHGYEYRGQKTGIMANGEVALHLAPLVNNLTDNTTILTTGKPEFNQEELNKLKKHNINIVESEINEIVHVDGRVEHVIFKDGSKASFDAIYAWVPFSQHSDIPASLGCELTEMGHLKIDESQMTSQEGIYACGDNSTYFRSVANAVRNGSFTGIYVNKKLIETQF